MNGFGSFWSESDGVGRAVTLLLLAMSVGAWVTILWKSWVLQRARRDVARAVPAFWAAPALDEGRRRRAQLDREKVLLPLLDAATALATGGERIAMAGIAAPAARDTSPTASGSHAGLSTRLNMSADPGRSHQARPRLPRPAV